MLDSQFNKEILGKANEIVDKYQIEITHPHEEGETYYGRGKEIPMAFGEGITEEECIKDTRESLIKSVATILENGGVPPVPIKEEDKLINLTIENDIQFIKSLLLKMENVCNFLKQNPPKYILAYNKMLGISQKINEYPHKNKFVVLHDIVLVRKILSSLLNGKYKEAEEDSLQLKNKLYSSMKNENNKNR